VSTDPGLLAHALAGYQRRYGLDDAALAAVLGCPVATLTAVRLCRRQGAAPGRTVAQDVDEIAGRIGIDAASLRWVVEAYPASGSGPIWGPRWR
jgi:hypothetical protein